MWYLFIQIYRHAEWQAVIGVNIICMTFIIITLWLLYAIASWCFVLSDAMCGQSKHELLTWLLPWHPSCIRTYDKMVWLATTLVAPFQDPNVTKIVIVWTIACRQYRGANEYIWQCDADWHYASRSHHHDELVLSIALHNIHDTCRNQIKRFTNVLAPLMCSSVTRYVLLYLILYLCMYLQYKRYLAASIHLYLSYLFNIYSHNYILFVTILVHSHDQVPQDNCHNYQIKTSPK